MQTELNPHIDIAPDHTKKEQEHFRYLRNECSERQAKGDRVIIINSRITQNKRSPKDYSVGCSAAPILPQNITNKMVNLSCLT